MKSVFEHIEQTRYLLSQIFESGFATGRNVSMELGEGEKIAAELGMSGGAELLRELSGKVTALAAGRGSVSDAVIAYCNAVMYYNMVGRMLVVETMANPRS
jgi:hypothetical protein